MPSHPRSAWTRLGELLRRRRIELDLRYRNRRTFEADRAPGLYRIINAIETGERDNYEPGTIAALEVAYDLVPGSIDRALDGGELEPQPVLADAAGAADTLAVTRTMPPRHDTRNRPEVAFDGGDPQALRPWRQQVLREIYEAAGYTDLLGPGRELPEPADLPGAEQDLALFPGWVIFPGDDGQARRQQGLWDDPRATLNEKVNILAGLRKVRAGADERERRRTGLGHYPATPLVSVAGTAARASS